MVSNPYQSPHEQSKLESKLDLSERAKRMLAVTSATCFVASLFRFVIPDLSRGSILLSMSVVTGILAYFFARRARATKRENGNEKKRNEKSTVRNRFDELDRFGS
jgi:hypothetical protein